MNKRKKQLLKMGPQSLDSSIKIQGTEFDRKRVLTPRKIERLKELYHSGLNFAELSRVFNVSPHTVKAYIDPAYRTHRNNLMHKFYSENGYNSHINNGYKVIVERSEYKRKLIARNQIAV